MIPTTDVGKSGTMWASTEYIWNIKQSYALIATRKFNNKKISLDSNESVQCLHLFHA